MARFLLVLLLLAAPVRAQYPPPPIPAGTEADYVEGRLTAARAADSEAEVAALIRLAFTAADPMASRGELDEAEKLFARIRTVAEERLEQDTVALGELLTHATKVQMWRGEFARAEDDLRTALEHLESGTVYSSLANNALAISIDRQRRTKEALGFVEAAVADAAPIRDEAPQAYFFAMNSLAVVLSKLNRDEEAKEVRAELQTFIDGGPELSPHMAASQHEGMAMLCTDAGLREEAEEHYGKAIAIVRDEVGSESANLFRLQYLYGVALVNWGDHGTAIDVLGEAVQLYEAWRSKPENVDRLTSVKSPWRALARAYVEDERPVDALQALDAHLARPVVSALEGRLGGSLEESWLDQVQAALGPDEALVGWLFVGEPLGFVYALRDEGAPVWAAVRGTRAGRFTTNVRFLGLLARPTSQAFDAPDPTAPQADARELYRLYLEPIADRLQGVKRLHLVSAQGTGEMAFGALIDGEGQLLSDRFDLVLQASPSAFALTRRFPTRGVPDKALLLGDPPFQTSHRERLASVETVDPQAETPGLRRNLRGVDPEALPRLPGTRQEVLGLAPLFDQADTLLGLAADPEALKARAQGAQVLHLATHAQVDPHRPLDGAVYLACDEEGRPRALTMREVQRTWRLDADLVALSACTTGRDHQSLSGFEMGFPQAFLAAGARSVLATLWAVDDRATRLFMEHFYRAWLGRDGARQSRASALRSAARAMREHVDEDGQRPYAHPYFWAGFVLYGDDR